MKAYRNPDFINAPDARPIRILAEYLEPEARFSDMKLRDTIVFFGSARTHSEEDAEAALKTAGAWDFVQDLEQGLGTMVGDRGSMLSGGQRARISLARAVLKQPSLLILDEASSALDALPRWISPVGLGA